MSLADTLSTLQAQVASLVSAMSGMPRVPRMQWGTVTALSPLTVTLDGDTAPCGVSWSAEVLTVGARVLVQVQGQDRWVMALVTTASAWQDYTPTITGITLGNGTVVARWKQVGKTVVLHVQVTTGSTTVMSGNPTIGLPVTCPRETFGLVTLFQAGNAWFLGFGRLMSAGALIAVYNASNVSVNISPTVPFTWSAGCAFTLDATYETS